MMKKKLFTTVLASLLFSGMAVSAQGIYENDLTVTEDDDFDAPLRAKPTAPPQPGEDSDDPAPIGEGLLVLSVLAGGYALVKKRSSKKESNL